MPQADEQPGQQQPGPHRQPAARPGPQVHFAPFAEAHHRPADDDGLKHILPQPGAQRDVPPPPELADAAGKKGLAEVFGQFHAEGLRRAEGNVHTARKFGVKLQRVQQHAQQDGQAGILRPIVKNCLYIHISPVRDDDFFEQAPHNALCAEGQRAVIRPGRVQQRRGHSAPAVKGSLDHMGPEAQVAEHLPVPGGGLRRAAVHIHQIADGHKREKADAQRLGQGRKGKLGPPGPVGRQPAGQRVQYKMDIFDAEHHAQQHGHAQNQQRFFEGGGLLFQRLAGGRVQRAAGGGEQAVGPVNGQTQHPHQRRKPQQPDHRKTAAAPVKVQAGRQKHAGAPFFRRGGPDQPDRGQKQQKILDRMVGHVTPPRDG